MKCYSPVPWHGKVCQQAPANFNSAHSNTSCRTGQKMHMQGTQTEDLYISLVLHHRDYRGKQPEFGPVKCILLQRSVFASSKKTKTLSPNISLVLWRGTYGCKTWPSARFWSTEDFLLVPTAIVVCFDPRRLLVGRWLTTTAWRWRWIWWDRPHLSCNTPGRKTQDEDKTIFFHVKGIITDRKQILPETKVSLDEWSRSENKLRKKTSRPQASISTICISPGPSSPACIWPRMGASTVCAWQADCSSFIRPSWADISCDQFYRKARARDFVGILGTVEQRRRQDGRSNSHG